MAAYSPMAYLERLASCPNVPAIHLHALRSELSRRLSLEVMRELAVAISKHSEAAIPCGLTLWESRGLDGWI